MGRANRIVGLVLCVVTMAVLGVSAEEAEPITLRVRFLDDVGVPADVAETARNEVSGIFRRSQISLTWIEFDACQGSCFTIKMVSKLLGDKSRNPKVIGIAPGTREVRGKLAYIFYERVRVYSAQLGLDTAQMLGHVIAHELGHLLLPYGSHTVAGIMRSEWDRAQVTSAASGTLRFTPVQVELIRERLQAFALPIARAR
jgi:hypothetical protein